MNPYEPPTEDNEPSGCDERVSWRLFDWAMERFVSNPPAALMLAVVVAALGGVLLNWLWVITYHW